MPRSDQPTHRPLNPSCYRPIDQTAIGCDKLNYQHLLTTLNPPIAPPNSKFGTVLNKIYTTLTTTKNTSKNTNTLAEQIDVKSVYNYSL